MARRRKEPPPTIDNDNGEPVVTRIPQLNRDNPLEGISDGYADIFDGLMNKSIDPKSAGQMNTSLRGKLQSHQAGFDMMQRAKLGDSHVRAYASKLLGIVNEPAALEDATKKKEPQ